MSTARKTKAAHASSTALYDTLAIDPSLRKPLEDSATLIFDLSRRSTEQTFELGEHLAQAAALLPDGTFDKWVASRCGLKARTARYNMAVFRNLSSFRDELVDLSVGSTALFLLSSANADQIEQAIAFANEVGRLQVADVKEILAGTRDDDEKASKRDAPLPGGISGLKSIIAAKTRDGVKLFSQDVRTICSAIEAALQKKRVIKETLAREIQELARVARLELENLALFVEPESDLRCNARPMKFPQASEWAVVEDTLATLGQVDQWKKSAEMRGWLQFEVLPVLEWAISKERRPVWPLARPAIVDLDVGTRDDLADNEAAVAVSGEAEAVGLDGVTDTSETRMLLANVPLLDDDLTLDSHAALDGDHMGSTDPAIIR